jgi:general secretion pathway protein L
MKPTRLILIPAVAAQPAPFLILAPDGFVLERGVLTLEGVERPEPMRTVAVTPGADVTIRWLDLPAGGAAQVRAAAAWSLRDDMAATPDRLATVLGPPAGAAGQPRLVAVVSRSLLEAWTDYLEALGVRADVLTPDVLTVPEPEADDELQAVSFGDNVALRGRRFAATVQPDLVDLVAAGRRVVPVEDPAAVERALVEAARSPAINLLDTGDRERKAAGSWRRAAVLTALVLVSPLVLTLSAAARDDMAARRMRAEAVRTVARAAPDLAAAADPAAGFRRRAEAALPPGGPTAAAAALYAAIEGVEGAELDILIADPDDGVKATVSQAAYQDMARIKAAMAAAGMSVTETSTIDDGGRVVSDITIGAAR